MNITRLAARIGTGAAAAVVATAVMGAASAQAHAKEPGTKSLAAVLTADTSGFDRNGHDYDILTKAVLTVLDAKKDSKVGVLADGNVALTAFIPNDRAFERLAAELTKSKKLPSEQKAFETVAGLGVDTVEAVLLYHVVPGATIDKKAALKADGAKLDTAAGASITVDVQSCWYGKKLRLIDADTNDRDPRVVAFDINKGNKQIAHGIDRVLRPVDLP